MRINLSDLGAKNRKLKFVNALMLLFAEDNDIKISTPFKNWLSSPVGAKALASWAQQAGYKINYWCMEPLKIKNYHSANTPQNEVVWIGFGIDVDETCPKIIELKLEH